MSFRLIPDLLTHGDAELGLPRRRGHAHIIGRGFPEAAPKPLPDSCDPASAKDIAVREWLAHVAAGRISGG